MNNTLTEWRTALDKCVENYQSTKAWYEENRDSLAALDDMERAEDQLTKFVRKCGFSIVLGLLDEVDNLRGELQELRKADSVEPVLWGAPKTVKQLIRQLQTLDPDLETTALLRMPADFRDGNAIRQVPLSISYERMDGQWLAPYKSEHRKVLAFWAKPDDRNEAERGELIAPQQATVTNEFIPKNLDRALGVVGVALPESKEEFNLQIERWTQRLIDRVIRYSDEFCEQPALVIGIDPALAPDRSVEIRYFAPPGWMMVPIEPTEHMIVEGFESEPDENFSDPDVWEEYQAMSGCRQAAHRAKLCWAAMIAAVPTKEGA